jgi:dolichyl-phosphate-mannose--protein O-mannosyl transferase
MFFANLKSHYLPWLFSVRNKKILTSLSIKGAIFLAECLLWETILYSLNKVLYKNKHNYRRRIRISLCILINSAQFAQEAFSSHLLFAQGSGFKPHLG